ncbi:MAG: phytanoyl-CoA dioxygenase family protein [Flavobacteriales bacterium]|nr:phytanoyl-CoA dioxygenase family protein [Flavobacteriales bacterium]
MQVKILQQYKKWKPLKNSVIKDNNLSEIIHESGYKVLPFLNEDSLTALKQIFEEEHDFKVEDGGMFYSLYSRDKAYRKRIHERIKEVLLPSLEEHFVDYKNVINTFVVKLPGEKSEFYVHQDTTGLDEFNYSPLSIWIPLDDITPKNGALTVIEKSHWFFSPYRGVSFSFPFKNISDSIKKYLKPVYMKAGEALFFDNRLVHNSLANTSDQPRIAIVCGIFPKEAKFRSCFQDQTEANKPIEVFEHEENYLLEYPHFFYNCTERPVSGKLVEKVEDSFPSMNTEEFEQLCTINQLTEWNKVDSVDPTTVNCQLIAEPDGINIFEEEKETSRGLISWLKRKIS